MINKKEDILKSGPICKRKNIFFIHTRKFTLVFRARQTYKNILYGNANRHALLWFLLLLLFVFCCNIFLLFFSFCKCDCCLYITITNETEANETYQNNNNIINLYWGLLSENAWVSTSSANEFVYYCCCCCSCCYVVHVCMYVCMYMMGRRRNTPYFNDFCTRIVFLPSFISFIWFLVIRICMGNLML